MKCDEESERIAEQFLAGDMDCDKFLQVYVKSRTVSFIIVAITITWLDIVKRMAHQWFSLV